MGGVAGVTGQDGVYSEVEEGFLCPDYTQISHISKPRKPLEIEDVLDQRGCDGRQIGTK